MEKDNKKRSTNFSTKEEQILISLVRKFKDRIECKKSDTNTNSIKLAAWKQVTSEFNGISGETYRHLQILRNKYENMKKRSKQKFADEKTYVKKTGGGPSKEFYFDDTDLGIREIVGTQMTGLESEFDDDKNDDGDDRKDMMDSVSEIVFEDISDLSQFPSTSNIQPQLPLQLSCGMPSSSQDMSNGIEAPLLLEHDYISSSMTTDNSEEKIDMHWSKYTPDILKKQISSPLRAGTRKGSSIDKEDGNTFKKNRNPLNSKLIEWSATKIELTEIQKAAFIEEHQLKLKHLQEKHDLMMNLQKAESVEKMKFLKEEHEMNMSILQEKKRLLR